MHREPVRTELVSLSRTTGAVNWTALLGNTLGTSVRLATAGDRLYVSGGRVFDAGGCGAATCAPLVDVPVDGTPTALSVSDGHLYVTNGTS